MNIKDIKEGAYYSNNVFRGVLQIIDIKKNKVLFLIPEKQIKGICENTQCPFEIDKRKICRSDEYNKRMACGFLNDFLNSRYKKVSKIEAMLGIY